MGFASDACWFLLIKTLLIKSNKKREAALKNEASGDEKHMFFLLGLTYLQRNKENSNSARQGRDSNDRIPSQITNLLL